MTYIRNNTDVNIILRVLCADGLEHAIVFLAHEVTDLKPEEYKLLKFSEAFNKAIRDKDLEYVVILGDFIGNGDLKFYGDRIAADLNFLWDYNVVLIRYQDNADKVERPQYIFNLPEDVTDLTDSSLLWKPVNSIHFEDDVNCIIGNFKIEWTEEFPYESIINRVTIKFDKYYFDVYNCIDRNEQ